LQQYTIKAVADGTFADVIVLEKHFNWKIIFTIVQDSVFLFLKQRCLVGILELLLFLNNRENLFQTNS
jgi:hypothetical protein